MSAPAWQELASCREVGPDTFAPEKYDRESVAEAKDICQVCPVWKPCRAAALAEEAGQPQQSRSTIRGGLTPRERAALDPKRRKEAA